MPEYSGQQTARRQNYEHGCADPSWRADGHQARPCGRTARGTEVPAAVSGQLHRTCAVLRVFDLLCPCSQMSLCRLTSALRYSGTIRFMTAFGQLVTMTSTGFVILHQWGRACSWPTHTRYVRAERLLNIRQRNPVVRIGIDLHRMPEGFRDLKRRLRRPLTSSVNHCRGCSSMGKNRNERVFRPTIGLCPKGSQNIPDRLGR